MHKPLNKFFYSFFKRIGDVIVSLIVLILLSPLLVVVFILLKKSQGSGVFFQDRPGKNVKIFRLVKFKTMTDARDENGNLLPDRQRLTKIGKVVRSTSLDELPQLLNVLKGDMSLVGPRPLLVKYLPLYNERQARRHDVKPGITGWAQVNGRNAISWKERFELDIYYVDNRCFMLDIKILLLTIKKVYKREGVNATNNTTMEAFVGEE